MVAKDFHKTKGSAKAEVGEIDTSAPFQSVKDAVNLFGEGAFSGEKPAIRKAKPQSAERVLAKETQLHLAEKQLKKFKEQLENAETIKAQALVELEKAKRTVEELTQQLKNINESKDSAIQATEAAKHQAKQFTEANNVKPLGTDGSLNIAPMETSSVEYMNAVSELDAAKQELRKIRQEYEDSKKAKNSAAEQLAMAEAAAKANAERAGELSNEIASVNESVEQVKLETVRAKDGEATVCSEKDNEKTSYKARLENLSNKLLALKKDIDPEHIKSLETQLAKTLSEIKVLQNEMESKRTADLDSVKTVTSELDGAKESLQKVVEQEGGLRTLVESLKQELDNLKKEHSELKDKEAETESTAGNLHVKLQKAKSELKDALAEEDKARGACDDMTATVKQLALERELAKHEAEEMKQQAEELKREAEAARLELEEAEKKLKLATHEAEVAKAAEARALDQIRALSEKTDAARSSTSEPGAQITISRDEFEALSRKVEESEKLAEIKVAAAVAQVEAVKAGENEAVRRLEATRKEIEEMKIATQEALKKAEMAEAARRAVEGELRRWREREQKKAAEAASRILAETENTFESSPRSYQISKQSPLVKGSEARKLEKAKTSITKKALMPSLTNVFLKKKNQVDGRAAGSGGSPSYLPGEKPSW
ncbi:WEB family protein At5g55860 [Andrographis paniculata]|uniref:WEB family protein At5g55860 n=1 Tax=Andrographis paniculata TaxID=175694 RepID=UPI0021E8071F|nr:WEB family protein At5g55860 [Andrographis paniculata]XP_051135105.1 WEB family protein At5g55860 [Andrographis paniculata]XP_051135106.1 WEB family protein At5g55860 [Andrographis paniculata]XP_051135107.1 WEB family protein At5g55860 [Andrographis paniculata]XP_051135108.1 WEB family protein At5g55860 [Andrographis paniculata]